MTRASAALRLLALFCVAGYMALLVALGGRPSDWFSPGALGFGALSLAILACVPPGGAAWLLRTLSAASVGVVVHLAAFWAVLGADLPLSFDLTYHAATLLGGLVGAVTAPARRHPLPGALGFAILHLGILYFAMILQYGLAPSPLMSSPVWIGLLAGSWMLGAVVKTAPRRAPPGSELYPNRR